TIERSKLQKNFGISRRVKEYNIIYKVEWGDFDQKRESPLFRELELSLKQCFESSLKPDQDGCCSDGFSSLLTSIGCSTLTVICLFAH
uniref:Chromo domain-containing protein n=1 Tax=Romanomermis culicivorax TaxID=13658 RepID=A0A915IF20_ROMCU